jgi:hypothetical protein
MVGEPQIAAPTSYVHAGSGAVNKVRVGATKGEVAGETVGKVAMVGTIVKVGDSTGIVSGKDSTAGVKTTVEADWQALISNPTNTRKTIFFKNSFDIGFLLVSLCGFH